MTTKSMWQELSATEHQVRFVDVDGVPMRVVAAGEQRDDALILIHGTSGHAEAYIRNIAVHAEHFRTYAVDMPGHGWSGASKRGYEIPAYVEYLRGFMDAEGIDRASISGESLGGWIAARFAMTYPDRIDRLVLNTAGGLVFNPEVMKRIHDLTSAAVKNPELDTVRTRLEFLMAHADRVTDELVSVRQAIYRRDVVQAEIDGVLCLQVPDIRRRNLFEDDELRGITAPTLVVWTSHDPTGPVEVGQKFADLIPDAKLVVMDDCGHWPQWENAPEFNQLHLAFLQGG